MSETTWYEESKTSPTSTSTPPPGEEVSTPLTSVQSTATEPEETDDQQGLPVDRGYAWVIMFGCSVCMMLLVGMLRTYGVLFIEFLSLLHLPVSTTTLVISAQAAAESVSGVLSQNVLLSLLSERQTMMLGGLGGGLALTLGYFATSLSALILTQGVLMGISISLIHWPSFVVCSKYFHRHRSLAMGVLSAGTNVGSILMPLLLEFLLLSFGLKGALLILGGLFLNVIVFASLLTPFEHYKRRLQRRLGTELSALTTDPEERDALNRPQASSDIDKTQEMSTGKADGHGASFRAPSHDNGRVVPSKKKTPATTERHKHTCSSLMDMIEFQLFKMPAFLLTMCSCTLLVVPTVLSGIYLPALALEAGVAGRGRGILLIIVGATGIVSKLIFGFLADRRGTRPTVLLGVVTIISCTTGCFTYLYDDFGKLAAYSVVYGFFGRTYDSLLPVVVVEMMSLEKMAKTLGFVVCFQGASMAAGHYTVGLLRDSTGSYHASFVFLNTCGLLSAAVLLLSAFLTRRYSLQPTTIGQQETRISQHDITLLNDPSRN